MEWSRDVLREVYRNLRYGGAGAVREFCWRTYLRTVPTSDPDPVFEEDWNLLVVLDACRADLFQSVAAEEGYERFRNAGSRTSTASTTPEWFEAGVTLTDPAVLAETAYVAGNPYTAKCLDASDFGLLDEVWRYAWDDDRGTIPPRPLTDRAIRTVRETNFERYVVHYMQPHFPSLADGNDAGVAVDRFGAASMSVWEDLRFGLRDEASVWGSYRENLRRVLDDVVRLLENVDVESTAITSDHGNAIGERGIYGHAPGIVHPALREVPWLVTDATAASDHGTAGAGREVADRAVGARERASGSR